LLTAESPKKSGGSEQYFEQQALNLMTGLLVYVLVSREFERTRRLDDLRALASMTETALKTKIGTIELSRLYRRRFRLSQAASLAGSSRLA
jgi:type IV secretory pathway TraG/TraD family ATPase VirD4